jgi:hypothetical protein
MSLPTIEKHQYGLGIEAKRAQLIKNRPELNPFNGSTSPEHWAYRQLAGAIGMSNMRTQKLRELVMRLPREFPDEAAKCERGLVRLWAGCVYYLLNHINLLIKLRESGALAEIKDERPLPLRDDPGDTPGALNPPRFILPPVAELLAALEHRPPPVFSFPACRPVLS